MTTRLFGPLLALLVLGTAAVSREPAATPGDDPSAKAAVRRPVAAVVLRDGRTVAVANSRTGTISRMDLQSGRVHGETAVAGRLSDLAAVPESDFLLALNDGSDQLMAVRVRPNRLEITARAAVGRGPASVVVSADGRTATVAALWSHQLDVVELTGLSAPVPALRVVRSIALPFCPRGQTALPGGSRVVVADAFGGGVAVVDIERGTLLASQRIPGHNIRGMALSQDGRDLYLTHQVLDEDALINWQTVHSGTLMANIVRRMPLEQLLDAKADLDASSEVIPAGMTGHGGGDPTDLLVRDDGGVAVCLGGVNEAIVINRFHVITGRVGVGRRPTRLVKVPEGRGILTVNTHDDSLSLLDSAGSKVVRTLPLGPTRAQTAAERGEVAFYDARLSHDGWLSCHSCHTDGHTNGLRADTQADGTDGAPKRVLTLRGSAHTDRWAWNGSAEELFDQVRKSMLTTMLSDGVEGSTAADLVEYIQSLPPTPARLPASQEPADRDQVARGRQVFLNHDCQSCHVPPLTYSSSSAHDVGLKDENGNRQFNPPSLRGVGHATRFFHDNRATTLESVFREYGHPSDTTLTDDELRDLVRFLKSL